MAPDCYGITGLYFIPPWGANAGFVTGREKTLVIDTGSNYISARTIYGYSSAVRESNQLMVINTEKHLDHIGGNSLFAELGIDIYGHAAINRSESEIAGLIADFASCTAHPFRRKCNEAAILLQGTTIVNPNIRITQDTTLDLGDRRVSILLTPGHTATNLSVFVPASGVLYCGDCIVNSFLPNLEDGKVSDWIEWEKSLAKLVSLEPEVIVPGHGDIINGKTAVTAEAKRTSRIIRQAIESGLVPTRLASSIELG